jgi:hypothetical protein
LIEELSPPLRQRVRGDRQVADALVLFCCHDA